MASLLDMLLGGQGGVLGGLPAPNDPAWAAIRAKLAQGEPTSGPAFDPSAIGGAAPDLSGFRNALGGLGGALMQPQGIPLDLGAAGGARPDTFGAGAQPTSLYNVNPSGFGFSPPAGPGPVPYPPTAPQGPTPAPPTQAPVSLLENRPPTSGTSRGANVPNTIPANTPPPRQEAPVYAPPQRAGPDIGGNLTAGLMNVLHNPFSPQGIGDLITGLTTGTRTDPVGATQQIAQRTYETLRQAGYSHPDAVLGATNPAVLNEMVKNAYQQPKFEKAGPGEAAYLVGGGAGRLGPGGGGPSGVSGAGVTQLTPGMTIQQKAAEEAAGQKQGQAAAVLPQTLTMADNALRTLDELQNHPGRQGLFAPTGTLGKLPAVPGSQGYDFVQKLKQAQGQIFISIFNQLRGGGSISDAEGEKGTQAAANLDRAQTTQAFDKAANDLRDVITKGRANAIKIAQGDTQPFATPQQPQASQGQASGGGGWTNVAPNIRVRPRQ